MCVHWSHHLCRPVESSVDQRFPTPDRFGEKHVEGVANRPTQAVETRNGDFRWR